MSANVEVFVDDVNAERLLFQMQEVLSPASMAEFLGYEIQPYIKQRASDRFASEGDDVSGPWLPLTDATIGIRESQGFSEGPINVRTGELENYITNTSGAITASPEAILSYPGRDPAGELGDKVLTAQQGKDSPRTPPRPVIGLDQSDLTYVLSATALHVSLASVL